MAYQGTRGPRLTGGSEISEKDDTRINLYDEVTAKIIGELEEGRFPWVQPWGTLDTPAPGLPRNALSGRNYSGVNVLILWATVIERAYPTQGWITFRQAQAAGGHVRKGEQGTMVVYADQFIPDAEKSRVEVEGGEARRIPFLKRFILFNVAQCEGLPPLLHSEPEPLPQREIVPVAERLVEASGVEVRVGGSEAYYSPARDYVQVPPQQAFFDQINFYRTCLHELTHATGHAKRLARDFTNPFGSAGYAREELIAEMGAAFLCATLGIEPTVRHADYIGAWLAILREDSRAIFRAASQASKASDWLLAKYEQPLEGAIAP